MPLPRRTPRSRHTALALAAMVLVLALAAPAGAMPVDARLGHAPLPASPVPTTIVQQPVAAPDDGGPTTLAYALTAFGVGLALVGAGVLGAHIATRATRAQLS
jgi:hypothetical protein